MGSLNTINSLLIRNKEGLVCQKVGNSGKKREKRRV